MSASRSSNDGGFDPYDPNKSVERPRAAPRLVDFTQPLPEKTLPPVNPRPYSPQLTVRAEQIVPKEDNPLRGWRGLGARLLSRDLWPREASTNALMVYYSGRLRGRAMEDFVGLLPWLAISIFEALLFFRVFTSFNAVWRTGIIEFFTLPILGAMISATMVAVHLRRNVRNLPLEEILLTRLKPVDIVQGLSIRPIAVQSAAVLFSSLLHMGMAIGVAMKFSSSTVTQTAAYLLVLCTMRWYFVGVGIESAAAYATRAHLCIRSPMVASLRMILDIFLLPLTLIVGGMLLVAFAMLSLRVALASPVFALLVLAAAGAALWGIGSLLVSWMRSLGMDAMDWSHHYSAEWWVNTLPNEESEGAAERGLFTPWKPMADRRRGYFAKRPPKGAVPGAG